MNPTRITLAACACATLALTGCQTTNNNIPWGARQDPVTHDAYPTITVEQPLQQFVAVDHSGVLIDRPDGISPMRVQVPLRSTAYEQMSVQYQFAWYDADERHLRDSGWRFAVLEPGQRTILEGNATTLEANKFGLSVRSAR